MVLRPFPGHIRFCIVGMFAFMLVGVLYFAKGFFVPVTVAFLGALVFSPVIRRLRKLGLPEGLGATFVVMAMAAGLAGLTWSLSGPVTKMINDAPQIGFELERKLAGLSKPVNAVKEAEKTLQKATDNEAEPGVQEVVVREPGLLSQAASGAPEILAGVGLTLVLLLFLLASGDLFYEKLVRSLPRLTDKKRWLRTVYDVERDVSHYLFTVTLINLGLGACITGGLYLAEAPNPLLWGVAAALLNFIPYLGPLVGIFALTATSILAFPTIGQAMIPPAIYLGFNIIEGQFVTPSLVGRRLQMNAVIVFLAIAFWGWVWGAVGVFLAVPILIVIKTFAHHAEGMAALEEFLGPRRPSSGEDDTQEAASESTVTRPT